MSAPRAVGVRAAYAEVPDRVRGWVDATLGSPVVETSEQVGGMSPGCATRVVCADGTRAFVKAVGAELNPITPELFRREVTALRLIGEHPLWARLLASYDEGGWVALLLEDVDGHHPDLSDDATLDQLLVATDELVTVLAERVPQPPAPDPRHGGISDFADSAAAWAASLDELPNLPDDLAPAWLRERARDLQPRVAALASLGTPQLAHFDIRNDNLLQRDDGSLVFVDWGATCLAPAWLDPLVARLERVEDPWFDASLASSPELARLGDDAVTAWLAGFGGFLAWRTHTAVDVNLPTLNEFRRTESRRFLAAAARRLDVTA